MALDQKDMTWLDSKFTELRKHVDENSAAILLREKVCRAEIDAKIGVIENRANGAAEAASALKVEVDWHRWYIRLALGGIVGSTALLSVLIAYFRG